mgnify:CR=1 FL=1
MKVTTKQLQQAIELHESGVTWAVIASYLFTNPNSLREQIKNYELQSIE